MSPEQAKGIPVDGRTDQYSLAVVGYRMLAGRLPFTDDSVHTVIYKHIFEMPPPLEMFRRDAPEFLRQAIHRALEKDVEDRFLTMEAFATAVWPEHPVRDYSVSAGMSRTSLDAATEITLPRRGKRRGVRLAMALGAVLVLAGGGAAGASLLLNRATSGETGAPSGASTQPTFIAAADTQPVASSPRADSAAAPPGTAADTAASGPPPAPPRVTVDPPVQRPAPTQPAREQPAVPEVGYVTIGVTYNGEPSYATVMIDGREIGEAPIIELQLPAGRHTLEIRREGYRPILDSIVVQPGDPSRATRVTKPLVKEQP
jgi:serine/threonine-protein kinase